MKLMGNNLFDSNVSLAPSVPDKLEALQWAPETVLATSETIQHTFWLGFKAIQSF